MEHRIDLEKVGIHVHPLQVVLRGRLVRRAGEDVPLDAMLVQQILSEIGRIREVRRVDLDLDNWELTGSGVEKKGGGGPPARGRTED